MAVDIIPIFNESNEYLSFRLFLPNFSQIVI